jgi:two-component system, chemotaxis family, chemotaxis protein CheY
MREGKYLILCIDDDPDVLVPLKIVLEAGGYSVVTASDAKQGIEAFRECKPDLVILDLMMEEIDAGMWALREMRAFDQKVPIYMLSSTGDYLYSTADVNELGLAGVFQKPVNPKLLLSLLDRKLGQA